jgi:periplasmic protein TonB
MPRDLFGNVTRPAISLGNRKWYTLPLSLFSHSAIVVLLIAVPILAPAAMPSVFADDDPAWIEAILPPPPPMRRVEPKIKRPDNAHFAPVIAPSSIAPETPAQLEPLDAAIPGVIDGTEGIERVLAPPPPTRPAAQTPVRAGSTVRYPLKVRDVRPVYSQMAQAARIQGIAIIDATIGVDGRVINARLLRSLPMLDQAALDAVRQWEFTPTLLNGVPIPVIMTITINFTLK